MNTLLPNQKTLFDLIIKDSQKIPRFIDTKSEEHHKAFLIIQAVYKFIYELAEPNVCSEDFVLDVFLAVSYQLKRITDKELNKKSHQYIFTKMTYYLKTAIQLECYEAAANFKNYLTP